MPAVFVGHGSPMNALEQNTWTRGWAAIGTAVPRPRAILSISAHWYVPFTGVTIAGWPETLHDFGGFPATLHEVHYPAPGSAGLAQRVGELLAPVSVVPDPDWGLDHGTWSVLVHMFPKADIPVVQLSIDATRDAAWHYRVAKKLQPLRDEGVLILGSGNIVHNLGAYAWRDRTRGPHDWAQRFEGRVRELLAAGDFPALVAYETLGEDARQSVPTAEHYLPLIYILAQRRQGDTLDLPVQGFDGGSISMLAARIRQ